MAEPKTIETLVEDIQEILVNGIEEGVPNEVADEFGKNMAELLKKRMGKRDNSVSLRMSNIGTPCDRKLWLQINQGEDKEKFSASDILKFLYGDLIEEALLALAQLAGHSVTGRQSELSIGGVIGHRDAVIDGVTVDVKSASAYSFAKFKSGTLRSSDPFGYYDQLQSYLEAGQSDELVTDKLRGAFLVADKVLGHLTLDIHAYDPNYGISKEFERKKDMIKGWMIPSRGFAAVPDGMSGNMKLDTYCSYCNVKNLCYTNLRTFAYSGGPRFLTVVKRQPEVPEV